MARHMRQPSSGDTYEDSYDSSAYDSAYSEHDLGESDSVRAARRTPAHAKSEGVHAEPLSPVYADELPAGESEDVHAERYHPTPSKNTETSSEKRRWLSGLVSWVAILAIAGVCALFIRTFIAEAFMVPTGSMLETIQLDDRLFGEKISYLLRDPQAGDIVTFEDPTAPGVILIKRIIAVEGQEVDLRDGVVYVDGVARDEPYVTSESYAFEQFSSETLDGPIEYPYVVPEGYVWVMGDNRSNSLDSRYFGAISIESITARGWFIYWPLEDVGLLWQRHIK